MAEQGAEFIMKERHRCSSWWLGVVVTMQCAVMIACMAFTFHSCNIITAQHLNVEKAYDDIFIQFDPIADISDNETLEFKYYTNKSVDLVDNKVIAVSCNGPYILHMYVCPTGLDEKHGWGRLELRVAGTQRANFSLEDRKDFVCQGLQTTVYLRRTDRATIHFSSEDQNLKIKNVTLGLRYLLGQCQY